MEARLVGRPIDRGSSAEERTLEALHAVVNLCCGDDSVPFHVEGHGRSDGGDRYDERIIVVWIAGQSQTLSHRVREVVIVEDFQPTHLQARSPCVEVYLNGVLPHWDHPEHVVRVDVYVVVVDLFGENCRSNRTGIQVKSNEGECAHMAAAVRTDELALTEAHVRLERQRGGRARGGVCSGPAAANVGQTDEPIEVSDL
jgi:hypothetical protein